MKSDVIYMSKFGNANCRRDPKTEEEPDDKPNEPPPGKPGGG